MVPDTPFRHSSHFQAQLANVLRPERSEDCDGSPFRHPLLKRKTRSHKRGLIDEILFSRPRQGFDLALASQGAGLTRLNLLVSQENRPPTARVTSTFACVVLIQPATEILCDTGVEGLVAALDNVDEPILSDLTA